MADGAAAPAGVWEGAGTLRQRHPVFVRITHWLTALGFAALLVSGAEIVISHPRFYWGEAGNVHTTPLFSLPIPASRAAVPTGYGFVLPDQNGWSRSLHFQAAWLILFTGIVYVVCGVLTAHFRRTLVPRRKELAWRALSGTFANHLRFRVPGEEYNTLQRLTYLFVIFVLFPLMFWTGLAMSPAVVSAFPSIVTTLGGQQSARTIHFFSALGLVAFVLVHLAMVIHGGFRRRVEAMITGRVPEQERA